MNSCMLLMLGANSETAPHTHCISKWEPHKPWLCYKNHRLRLKKGFCFLKCILQCCQTDLSLSITLFWGNMIYATLALLQQSTYRRSSSPSTWTDLLKSTSPFILLLEMKRVLKNLGRSGSLPGERLGESLADDRAQMWVTLEGPQPICWYFELTVCVSQQRWRRKSICQKPMNYTTGYWLWGARGHVSSSILAEATHHIGMTVQRQWFLWEELVQRVMEEKTFVLAWRKTKKGMLKS